MSNRDTLLPRWQKRLILWLALGLALTGMGQMPIFARYGIASLPGLHWLGDYRMTAALHLALAAILLVLTASLAVSWLGWGRNRPRLSGIRTLRVVIFAGVLATGGLRVLQNGAWPLFGPYTVRYLDWSHLALALALGLAALIPVRPTIQAEGPAGSKA